jgi:U3 small nucleolar RNA-associated protein 4
MLIFEGIDTQPIVVPIRQFGKELSRGLPALPHTPPLVSARDARLMVSWWNCELRVWRVKSQDDGTEKPKAVARLALRGEENITSVTMTRDGGLLAVATIRQVKMFQLIEAKQEVGSSLRIRKLEMPSDVGARMIRFTPDGKWLAIVTPTNDIFTARVVRSDDPLDRPRILHKLLPLHRLPRDELEQDPLDGATGQYGRSVTQAEFSTDGTVFAVADLAGYIDTWVTEGHEDLTAPEVDIDEPAALSADDDESDDEDVSREQITFLGQRWVRNPAAHLLPRLHSAPALLSFQPTPEGAARPEPNGNPAVHPTRHNPHPHSHDIPDTEHRLVVVSAHRQMHLFDVMAGRLSEWSRRNPPSSYPSQYRTLKSSAKGCIWDVAQQQRIWLYGESWLFMFDLSRDLPVPESADASDPASGADELETKMSKKRKREAAKENARKGTSGAGDVIPENDAPVTKLRRYNTAQDNPTKVTQIALHEPRMVTDSDIEYDDDDDDALASLRRLNGTANGTPNGHGAPVQAMEAVEGDGTEAALELRQRSLEPWWHTFKYRPILGIVPISSKDDESLEVVLVERPSWDLDLPPKFVGAHEG